MGEYWESNRGIATIERAIAVLRDIEIDLGRIFDYRNAVVRHQPTPRDIFAAAVLQGTIAHGGNDVEPALLAPWCFEVADAMELERTRKASGS